MTAQRISGVLTVWLVVDGLQELGEFFLGADSSAGCSAAGDDVSPAVSGTAVGMPTSTTTTTATAASSASAATTVSTTTTTAATILGVTCATQSATEL